MPSVLQKITGSRSVELPIRHHHSPAFSLVPWAGADANVCEMRMVPDLDRKIVAQRKHPNATGFVRNLYKIDGVPEPVSQHLETNFMKPLDTRASIALNLLLSGQEHDVAQRSDWTRYVMSRMFRHPFAVNFVNDHFRRMWGEGVDGLAAKYLEKRDPDGPATIQEFVDQAMPAAAAIDAAGMMVDIIDNDRVGPTIFNLKWILVDIPQSRYELLTSDRPLVRPVGFDHPQAYLALPLSPRKLWLASHTGYFARNLKNVDQTMVAREINKVVVSQAREFVWGTDASQLSFTRKYMAVAPEHILLTAEQEQEALKAVRGERRHD
jgi:hypothetical protein